MDGDSACGEDMCLQPVPLFTSSPLVSFIASQPKISPPKSEHSETIISGRLKTN